MKVKPANKNNKNNNKSNFLLTCVSFNVHYQLNTNILCLPYQPFCSSDSCGDNFKVLLNVSEGPLELINTYIKK